MPRWNRFPSVGGWTSLCAIALALVACSLGDFDSLGAGDPDQNVGGSSGSAGRGGSGGTAGTGGSGGDAGDGGTGGSGGSEEPVNLIENSNFDSGSSQWTCIGNCITSLVEDNPRSAPRCLFTTNRTQSWEGPSLNLMSRLTAGASYRISLWVRTEPSTVATGDGGVTVVEESYSMGITQKRKCASTDPEDGFFLPLTSATASGEWSTLTATFTAPDCPDLQESSVYVEGAPVGAEFCIDDTSLTLVE